MERGLLGKQEPGAEPDALRAEDERGREPAAVGDAACCEHGQRRHRVHDRRHERQGGDLAPDVPAGLPALSAHDVDARVGEALRLLRRPHGADQERARGVHALDVPGGISPRERDDLHPRVERGLEAILGRPLEQDVGVERLRRAAADVVDDRRDILRLRPAQRDRAERAGLGHGGCERGNGRPADRRLDDRRVDPEQVAKRRAHPRHAIDPASTKASAATASGPSSSTSPAASSRACSSRARSATSRAKRKSVRPDWRVPSSSPAPRSSRSLSASSKPSVVSTIACSRAWASRSAPPSAARRAGSTTAPLPARPGRAAGGAGRGRSGRPPGRS